MKNILWIFAVSMLFCVGCRTYVGSDDVFETGQPEVLKKTPGLELRRGVIMDLKNGKYVLTFAERSLTRLDEKKETYYCGRKYYYLIKDNNLFFNTHNLPIFWNIILTPAALPFQWCHDGFLSWTYHWHWPGEYAPGPGYFIAYLPIVHLFFTPFLRPPYAYEKFSFRTEFDELQSHKLVMETASMRFIPVFTPASRVELLISHRGQTISKNLSHDGKVEFGIADFSNIPFDGTPAEFAVTHRQWGQRWIIRSPQFVTPESLRDWNILSDVKYDYSTRLKALMRLESIIGEKRCHEYLRTLLSRKSTFGKISSTEIGISGNPPPPSHRASAKPQSELAPANKSELANKISAAKFLEAATNGNAEAEFQLGMCYYEGRGVKMDRLKAKMWLRSAADHGHEDARKALQALYTRFEKELNDEPER